MTGKLSRCITTPRQPLPCVYVALCTFKRLIIRCFQCNIMHMKTLYTLAGIIAVSMIVGGLCYFLVRIAMQFYAPMAQLVEQLICNQQVGGSSPSGGTTPNFKKGSLQDFFGIFGDFGLAGIGALVQSGERLICIQEVVGSIPSRSTK